MYCNDLNHVSMLMSSSLTPDGQERGAGKGSLAQLLTVVVKTVSAICCAGK